MWKNYFKYDSNGNVIGVNVTYNDLLDSQGRPVYIRDSNPNASKQLVAKLDSEGRTIYVPDTNPNAEKTLVARYDKKGRPIYVTANDPDKFISSSSTDFWKDSKLLVNLINLH